MEAIDLEDAKKCATPVISPVGIREIETMIRKLRLRGCKDTTMETYDKALRKFYVITGIDTIEKVTLDDIDRYKEHLLDKKMRSANRLVWYVKTYLRRMGQGDLASKVENIKVDRNIPDILTEEEVDRLYDTARRYPSKNYGKQLQTLYTAIVSCLYYSGLRRFELSNLTIKDVDLKECSIRVVHGKGGKSAWVPVNEQCIKDIKQYLEYRPNIDSDRLFISLMGNPINPDVITRTIKKLSAKAKIDKHVTAHTLRRSMATHLIENGASQYAVKQILRHDKLTTTDLYVNLSKKKLRESYKGHIKSTIGKQRISKEEKKKKSLTELNDAMIKGHISEETYQTIRADLLKDKIKEDFGNSYM